MTDKPNTHFDPVKILEIGKKKVMQNFFLNDAIPDDLRKKIALFTNFSQI